ncbi:MAG: hypothetical protein HDR25_07525 [Lachnospiraceae bacterium]|nr:hypothetical protein [Lachnospiraceae bacterium]
MYKKEEKKFNYLLDKLLLLCIDSEKNKYSISYHNGQILDMLWGNKELLPVSIQEKIIKILPITHSWVILSALAKKDYRHWSNEIVKLLDLNDPYFSEEVIRTLFKMGTYQYAEEIYPFAVLSIDDKMPFSSITYREGLKLDANSSFQRINDEAKKYIKKAEKLNKK